MVVSPAAPKRPPATLCQPSGLGWPAEREANISRAAALARANLSLMQPWVLGALPETTTKAGGDINRNAERLRAKSSVRSVLVVATRVKSEGRKKAEARIALDRGFRSSDFGTRPSFGPRISGFGLQSYLSPALASKGGEGEAAAHRPGDGYANRNAGFIRQPPVRLAGLPDESGVPAVVLGCALGASWEDSAIHGSGTPNSDCGGRLCTAIVEIARSQRRNVAASRLPIAPFLSIRICFGFRA